MRTVVVGYLVAVFAASALCRVYLAAKSAKADAGLAVAVVIHSAVVVTALLVWVL